MHKAQGTDSKGADNGVGKMLRCSRQEGRNRVDYGQLLQDSGYVRIGYGAENLRG